MGPPSLEMRFFFFLLESARTIFPDGAVPRDAFWAGFLWPKTIANSSVVKRYLFFFSPENHSITRTTVFRTYNFLSTRNGYVQPNLVSYERRRGVVRTEINPSWTRLVAYKHTKYQNEFNFKRLLSGKSVHLERGFKTPRPILRNTTVDHYVSWSTLNPDQLCWDCPKKYLVISESIFSNFSALLESQFIAEAL